MADIETTAKDILLQYWGYHGFRKGQLEVIKSILEGNNALALMPTGGGKSICFQVPAMMLDGICIVISPLISLMIDQVEALNNKKIKAYCIHSGLSKRETGIIFDNCINGPIKFLYISPERLISDSFQDRLKNMKISFIAVDEAHCISQWGHDFRPSYLQIATIKDHFPNIKILAVTASANQKAIDDILLQLKIPKAEVFKHSFAKPNLSYSIFKEEDKERKMLQVLNNVPGTSIIYASSRSRCMEISNFLINNRISADYYHAGILPKERLKKQQKWIQGFTRVIVATNAFGMGIDKSNVRSVIHMDIPNNIEGYYQEAGRAGRDEHKAYAVGIYKQLDIHDMIAKQEQYYPSIEILKQTYQQLINYCQVATGVNGGTEYDFSIETFYGRFHIKRQDAFYALKRLEEMDFITMNDAFYQPSKVLFAISQQEMYKFQIANSKIDPLIKCLTRVYGGILFTNHTIINENVIAKHLTTNVETVVKGLEYLHKISVIEYRPQKENPLIFFNREVYNPNNLPINVKWYEEKKQNDFVKLQAIINLFVSQNRCRSEIILEYFDEKDCTPCGICDVCLAQKKKLELEYQENESLILDYLIAQPEITIDQLQVYFKDLKKDYFLLLMERLLSHNKITFTESNLLKIVSVDSKL